MNFGFKIFDWTNVGCEVSEIKPQLVVGGIFLITGRILATVGGAGAKLKKVKWKKNIAILRFWICKLYHYL